MRINLKTSILSGLICATLLSLTACSAFLGADTHTDPTEDLSALTYPPLSSQTPPSLYRFPSIQDVGENDVGVHPSDNVYLVSDENGNPILRVSISLPVITYVENIGLESAVQAILAETAQTFTDRADDLSALYQADAQSGYPFFLTPSYSVSYSITSYSENRISLLYSITETNADGIVSRSHVCKVIDLTAGFSIDLSTLFTAGLSDRLLSLVNASLANSHIPLLPSYEGLAAAALPSCFLLVPEGICFLFSTGSLTPADQGDVTVLLTTAQLNELLSEYGAVILEAGDAYVPETD